MKWLWLLFMGLVCAVPAHAGDSADWVMGVWPSASSCPQEKAAVTDLKAVLDAPKAFTGHCVVLKGFVHARAVFLDPDDMAMKYASSNPKIAGRRIGISGPHDIMKTMSTRYDEQYVEMRGMIMQCEETGFWMGGYCHYAGGPFIGIVSVKAAREPLKYQDN